MASTGIVAFAFGQPASIWSNRSISDIATRYAKKHGSPVFTQQDIQFVKYPDWEVQVTYCTEEPGKPPPSLRIAREAIRWALDARFDSVLVVAAKPHLWRCMRDMGEASEEIGAPSLCITASPEINYYGDEVWYCLDSDQPRTRSKEAWRKRERILELMPFSIYKFVAS